MRLSEDKLKAAILHPDLEIRQRATNYFAKSYSQDLSIMPLVIKAVETFGREGAYHLIGSSRDLPQTEDTIAWVIDELNNELADQYENYAYNLSMVLIDANPALLLPRESTILDARHFLPDLRAPFVERLQTLSWDEATCWRKLEDVCEEGKDKQYVNDINWGHAKHIVEALARYGDACEEKVLGLVREKVADYRHNPMKWMEPLAVRLAGQARLISALPLLIDKLMAEDGDLLNEECAESLTRIGTPAVVQAVAEVYPKAPRHFRLYAIEPLEHIRTDMAVERCLDLLHQEKDEDIQVNLAYALLSHFSQQGIEEARKLLVGRKLDFERIGLRNYLVETCTIMGETFPEYHEWRFAEKAEKEEHRRRIEKLEGNLQGMLLYAFEKLAGNKASEITKAKPSPPRWPTAPQGSSPPTTNVAVKQKVGRNDPCPCGSRKKHKHCCMRK